MLPRFASRPGFAVAFAAVLAASCARDRQAPAAATGAGTDAATATWLREAGAEWGLGFRHAAAADGAYSTPDIIGSGGALFDYDGDGDLDLYLVDAGAGEPPPANRLYRQDRGRDGGRFVDVTAATGAGDPGYGMGAAVADVDNDGDHDLYATNLGPDAVYLNRGDGSFRRAGPEAGVGAAGWSTSACFLDFDEDGALDLFVTTYLRFEPDKRCTDSAGNPEFCGPDAFRGVPDLLYRGLGDGRFVDVSASALPDRPANKGLGVICTDLDGDGRTDIYVANDGEKNQLWINQGDGTFAEHALLLGAALNLFGRPEASMGVAAGDLDGDLDVDLFMTHLDRETNTFYANLGEAGFEDRTPATGLGPASMPYTGFGTALFDLDLDGDLDLASVNGRVRRGASLADREERRQAWEKDPSLPAILEPYAEPNSIFVNEGGARFREASDEAGWGGRPVAVSRGLLAGDLDEDGDPDLVVTNCGGAPELFLNQPPRDARWLAVEAIDRQRGGRDALGARVEVEAGGRRQLRSLDGGYGYLSASRARALFGLGPSRADRVTVTWPDGRRVALREPRVDRVLRFGRRVEREVR